jgi:hypothetical protein
MEENDIEDWGVRQCRRALRGLALDGSPLGFTLEDYDRIIIVDRLRRISRRNPKRWRLDHKGRYRHLRREWGGIRYDAGRKPFADRSLVRSERITINLTIPDMAFLKALGAERQLSARQWLQTHVTDLRKKMQGLS